MTLEKEILEELKQINASTQKIAEAAGLEFALELLRYIARKLRTGEAIPNVISYYQLVAPAGIFIVTFPNPEGYVWIGIALSLQVSQNGVVEFTGMVDDQILPHTYVPRLTSQEVNLSETVPFGHVIKETTTLTFVNHDIANQWLVGYSVGIFLRKDVWERDSALMDRAAERYISPAPPPAPPV